MKFAFLNWICGSASAEYAEKYQEMLARQDYFYDTYGENGNEAWVHDILVHVIPGRCWRGLLSYHSVPVCMLITICSPIRDLH